MNKERVIQLIKKIKRLSEDPGATEGEMQMAALKMQQLLKIHNLTMLEVDDIEDADKKENIEVGVHQGKVHKRSSLPKFEKILASMVAKACECSAFTASDMGYNRHGKWVRKSFIMNFVGVEIDCIIANEMYIYLNKTVYKLARAEFKANSEINSFWYGALARLAERFKENEKQFEEEIKDKAQEYAMVLVSKNQLVKCKLKELNLKHTKSKNAGTPNPSNHAYERGYEQADNLDISSGKHLE